jgi:NAD-dependent protein deacetylase/lipoamidase
MTDSSTAAATRLAALLADFQASNGRLLILTGAGISAESGIPTFRGKDGYWTIGSSHYAPMQMATHEMFERAPDEVWAWYLMRFAACRGAEPNPAHHAIARIERLLGERMSLVTQNIDGLHQRAGSSSERTFAIHGDASQMRCASFPGGLMQTPAPSEVNPDGAPPPTPPQALRAGPQPRLLHTRDHNNELVDLPELEGGPLSQATRRALTCTRCGGWMRPHVLWFDEYYSEELFRAESAFARADAATLLLVVGTTGSTTLPVQIGLACARRGVPIIDVNLEDNPFSELAGSGRGLVLRETATGALPRIAALLGA